MEWKFSLTSRPFKRLAVSHIVLVLTGIAIGDVDKHTRALACRLLTLQRAENQLILPLLNKDCSEVDLPWSFCGNFIIALEDEFRLVRLAAIQAMRSFALASGEFADKALECFVDSLQDENNKVRVASFAALVEIYQAHQSSFAPLSHLEAILSHLDDHEAETRHVVRELLAHVRIHELEGLLRLVRCVPLAMNRHPQEGSRFVAMLVAFGGRNSGVVYQGAQRLLKVDKFFMNPEPRIEDLGYLVRLIVILAAMDDQHEMEAAVPSYVFRHYHYLRAKYPAEIPNYWGHRLHPRLFESSPPLDEARDRTQLSPFIDRLQRIIERKRQGLEYVDALASLWMNLRYAEHGAASTSPLCKFMLRVAEGLKEQERVEASIHAALLGFEGPGTTVLHELAAYLEGTKDGGLPALQSLTEMWELVATLEETGSGSAKAPLKTRRQFPLLVPIKGRLNRPTSRSLLLAVEIPGREETYVEKMFVTPDLIVCCNLKIFPHYLAGLAPGPSKLSLSVRVTNATSDLSCRISTTYPLWIDIAPSPR